MDTANAQESAAAAGRLVNAPGYIVFQGQPAAVIVTEDGAGESVLDGARELQRVLQRVTGAELPIHGEGERPDGPAIFVGHTRAAVSSGVSWPREYPGNEGYRVVSSAARAFLLGNDAGAFTGTEHACYEFLEQATGVRWLYPGELGEVFEPQESIRFPSLDLSQRPSVMFRRIGMYREGEPFDSQVEQWRRRNRLNGAPVAISHGIAVGVPPATYAETHPEYYALINGERTWTGEWQPCTSNPDVIRLTIEAVKQRFRDDPHLFSFSLMQRDCGGFCQCPGCRALDGPTTVDFWGNYGPRLLHFANAVAEGIREEFPEHFVFGSTYWHTAAPPADPDLRAGPGVRAQICYLGCLAHPIEDPGCPTNAQFLETIHGWKAAGAAPITFYEYHIAGKGWLQMLRPQVTTQIRNLALYQALGTDGFYMEAFAEFGPDGPTYYAAARSVWPGSGSSPDEVWHAWCRAFGPGAGEMRRFYAVLEDAISSTPLHHPRMGSSWTMPQPPTEIYTEEVMGAADGHFQAADRLVEQQGRREHKERMARERLLWQYTRTVREFLAARAAAQQEPERDDLWDAAQAHLDRAREMQTTLRQSRHVSNSGPTLGWGALPESARPE